MSARRRHSMPFGAQLSPDGAVRCRLWAPAAHEVELMLYDVAGRSRSLAMMALPEGWFELVTQEARAGSRYRYRIDGKIEVPDPASRSNPEDIQGPSEVVDPSAFEWDDDAWRGRPWREAVIYELHVGTFSPEGTFAGAAKQLDHLAELGVTVIELMPIADFPGTRGWGYDGVLQYAPESAYGSPEDLKSLVAAAHRRGIAMMLDVVYNHFGPEGNYLHLYAPQFFTDRHHTPWGAALNFDGAGSRTVRDFYIHNALYWLEEYHFDGLRFDAVHAIIDDSEPNILNEIARAARTGPGRERPIFLVLENGDNRASFLGTAGAADTFDAQWNDDVHHCLHTLLTGESDGYYEDYAENPHAMLCRCLAEGFAYQGQVSPHQGGPRGEPSAHLPPTAFVNFLQNHDQIGNRALGERIAQISRSEAALRAATAVLLLSPSPPLLFMGEEWEAPQPFPYFCDFEPELASKVREGRKREFARFEKFRDREGLAGLPDPTDIATFRSACLDWSVLQQPPHAAALDHHRRLLAVRQRDIVPLIPKILAGTCIKLEASGAFAVDWRLDDGGTLHLLANLTERAVPVVGRAAGRMIFATHPNIRAAMTRNELAPWSVTWLLERGVAGD
ncbi:MAG: malto-oligosyltrehalose trehalohydrolase [Gammaproteobacteria bacterium]|jgi:maltooligosyltrehalose trehalohydrolase|nr:malto-oligosyltrehalose trehalohydrolase [Gammaproteobacteria bacterium]